MTWSARRRASAAEDGPPAPDTPQELKARALRLLARREHTRAELERKLVPHAGSGEAVRALLAALVERKQLSEARYAESRVRVMARKYGAGRLRQELRAKGVADEVAELAMGGAGDELARARAILERKYRAPATDAGERARRARFLLGRGFSVEVARRALGARGEDD